MQAPRTTPPQNLLDLWDTRPLAVPPTAVEISHTTSVVRGEPISSVPNMAVPKDHQMTTVSPSHPYNYTMHELQCFMSINSGHTFIPNTSYVLNFGKGVKGCPRLRKLNREHTILSVGNMDTLMWLALLSSRVLGYVYMTCAVMIPRCETEKYLARAQWGSIEELFFLRNTPLPSLMDLPMPNASGIPLDEVIVQRDEMSSGEHLAVQSARASGASALLATHCIAHTHVDRTRDDDVEIYYTYEYVRTSDWMIPSQDAHVQLSTHPGSQLPTHMWDQCLAAIERHGLAILMAQLVTHVDSSSSDATYLASDKPGERAPRQPGPMGHMWDDRGIALVDLIYGDHVDTRGECVRHGCQNSNIRKGIDGTGPVASFYSVQRPLEYHGIDEYVRETASRWNTVLSPNDDSPPLRPWEVFSTCIGLYIILSCV